VLFRHCFHAKNIKESNIGTNGRIKLSLCFNWAPRHEGVLGEWRYSSTHSLTSALDGREWSASRPGRFTPRERAPGTHWIGGWVGPRAVLNAVVKRKIPSPRRESKPRTPIDQPVAQRYTDWAITALQKGKWELYLCTNPLRSLQLIRIKSLSLLNVAHRIYTAIEQRSWVQQSDWLRTGHRNSIHYKGIRIIIFTPTSRMVSWRKGTQREHKNARTFLLHLYTSSWRCA
jgi:hypothetical protein